MKDQRKINLLVVKALEEIDTELGNDIASQLMQSEEIDRNTLSKLLEDSLMGNYVNSKDNQPVQLSTKTMMTGFLNLIDRIQNERNSIDK